MWIHCFHYHKFLELCEWLFPHVYLDQYFCSVTLFSRIILTIFLDIYLRTCFTLIALNPVLSSIGITLHAVNAQIDAFDFSCSTHIFFGKAVTLSHSSAGDTTNSLEVNKLHHPLCQGQMVHNLRSLRLVDVVLLVPALTCLELVGSVGVSAFQMFYS